MDSETDNKYHAEAKSALDKSLFGHSWSSYIKKKNLLLMYTESKVILNKKHDNKKLMAVAESVNIACIRIVRCLCIADESAQKTLLRGRVVSLDAEPLYHSAERDLKMMRHLLMKS